jgi:hypothetical protein
MATNGKRAKFITKGDFRTATWLRVAKELEADLVTARERLESFDNTPETTAALRGRIAHIRTMLARASGPAADPDRVLPRQESEDDAEPAPPSAF